MDKFILSGQHPVQDSTTESAAHQEKNCSGLALFASELYHIAWGDGMKPYCDKTSGKIETNPILDMTHLPPK